MGFLKIEGWNIKENWLKSKCFAKVLFSIFSLLVLVIGVGAFPYRLQRVSVVGVVREVRPPLQQALLATQIQHWNSVDRGIAVLFVMIHNLRILLLIGFFLLVVGVSKFFLFLDESGDLGAFLVSEGVDSYLSFENPLHKLLILWVFWVLSFTLDYFCFWTLVSFCRESLLFHLCIVSHRSLNYLF